jgi:NAD(P)-dependent dehydrogenase (short-subunit alcohol dehydrogenase family)
MTKAPIVHSADGVPCLSGELFGPGDFSVLVVLGANGALGSGLVGHFRNAGLSILAVDINRDCKCLASTGAPGSSLAWELHFRRLWESASLSLGIEKPFRALVTATRSPAYKQEKRHNWTLEGLDSHHVATFTAPIAASSSIIPFMGMETMSKIIYLASTNGTTLSNQSLGYHASSAALIHAARHLSVQWREVARVYCVAIGVINIEENDASKAASPGVQQSELRLLVDFLLSNDGAGMLGEPIFLSAGRMNLDATAVHRGEFGDLGSF